MRRVSRFLNSEYNLRTIPHGYLAFLRWVDFLKISQIFENPITTTQGPPQTHTLKPASIKNEQSSVFDLPQGLIPQSFRPNISFGIKTSRSAKFALFLPELPEVPPGEIAEFLGLSFTTHRTLR